MKSLKNLEVVQEALSKIAKGEVMKHDNGTFGKSIKCYFWDIEVPVNKEKQDLLKAIITKKYSGLDYAEDKKVYDEMKDDGEKTWVFKLVEPMYIRGTKEISDNKGHKISPEVSGCREIYIHESLINMEAVMYDETEDVAEDAQGREVPIIDLHLLKCLLDVKEGQRDFNDPTKWFRSHRVYVTDISYRSQQVVGAILNRAESYNKKFINFLSDQQLATYYKTK